MIAVTAAGGIALPQHALAQSTGLEDMVGARAGQAELELQRRGYRNTGGEQGDDRSYTFWWNADRRQCVTIATMDGRYASITASPPPDCRQSADNRPASRPRPGYAPDPAFGRPAQPPYPKLGDDVSGGEPSIGGRPVDLALVCFGGGSRNGVGTDSAWVWNPARERYENRSYPQTTIEEFDATLMVQIGAGGGRIRLPRSLVPPINSRGDRGWWDLYDVSVGPALIRASYRLNGLNKPRVLIDRRTGRISVQGTAGYAFQGSCDLIGDRPRRF
ncbi:hypothetical protein HMF7854_03930 [Sphingomonas ginkgonis]|uniref:Uncharacterized protein n=1 Tax=Sphingomonas ginkgonis TaxID=2315330 RepID=A0A429VE16_9SPHN|nr:hypothetical protein HMF7854_03930 [Sphingomonas ginkgonis]